MIQIRSSKTLFHGRHFSYISRQVFRFQEIRLNADLFHPLVHPDPALFEIGIEVGILARELGALKAEVDTLLPGARRNPAVRILAIALAAAPAVRFVELLQQLLESRIILEYRQKPGEPFRIAVEGAEKFF